LKLSIFPYIHKIKTAMSSGSQSGGTKYGLFTNFF
jgi:hypothetical protein